MTSARVPPRNNAAQNCSIQTDTNENLPSHIDPCACPTHDGVCTNCNFKITIGPSGVEYGHARARNHSSRDDMRSDCPHRPSSVDPTGPAPYADGDSDE